MPGNRTAAYPAMSAHKTSLLLPCSDGSGIPMSVLRPAVCCPLETWSGWMNGCLCLWLKRKFLCSACSQRSSQLNFKQLDAAKMNSGTISVAESEIKCDHPSISFSLTPYVILPFCLLSGLQSQHLLETAVERPSAGLQRVPRRLAGPRPLYVGLHLETWLVLCQRERGQLPRGHHRQQAAAHFEKRQRAVQHTVSGGSVRLLHCCYCSMNTC